MNNFTQQNDAITCALDSKQIGKAFQSASKNLGVNEKHFKKVNLFSFKGFDDSITLEDNTFSDITFDKFNGIGLG